MNQELKKKPLLSKVLVFLLGKCKIFILILVFLPFVNAIFNSYFFTKYVNLTINYLTENNFAGAQNSLNKIIFVIISLQILRFIQRRFLSNFLEFINYEIKKETFTKFNNISLKEKDLQKQAYRVNQLAEKIIETIHMGFSLVYRPLCSLLINIYTMCWLNFLLGRIFMIFVVIFLATLPFIVKTTFQKSQQLNEKQNQLALFLQDISNNFFFEKLFLLKDLTRGLFMEKLEKEKIALKNKYDNLALAGLYGNLLCEITCCIMLSTTLFLTIPISTKILAITLIDRFFSDCNDIPDALIPLLNNLGAMRENLLIFQGEEETPKELLTTPIESVELQNISFYYHKNKYIFENFSYIFTPGLYLLKGASGKGKSTLIKIIAGLLEPTNGLVIFNHLYNTKNYSLQKNISYMPQNDGIYNRTVIDNITFNNPSPSIEYFCEKFKMTNILLQVCDGKNLNISGGQMRRINLLRLINFYKNGNVLIFDEPLVGLDPLLVEEIVAFILSFSGIVIVCEHSNFFEKYSPTILNI